MRQNNSYYNDIDDLSSVDSDCLYPVFELQYNGNDDSDSIHNGNECILFYVFRRILFRFFSVLISSALVTFFSGLFNMLVTGILIPDFSFGFIIVNSVFVFLFVWLVRLAETLDLFNAQNLEIVKRKRRKAIQTGYQKECGQKYLSSETIKVLESHRKTLTNESILYPMFALLLEEEDLVNFSHLSESYKHLEKKGSNYSESKRTLNKLYESLVNEIWERREEEPSIEEYEYENNLYNKTNEETIKMAEELIVKKRKRKNYE